MFRQIAFISLILIGFFANGQQTSDTTDRQDGEVRYITDDLYTFMHAGPGRNYRILGSVEAGTRVIQLQVDRENEYVEIIDDKQRTGWVEAKFITPEQSIKQQLPNVRENLNETTAALEQARETNDLLNQQIAELSTQNNRLKSELEKMMDSNQKIQQQLKDQDQTARMEWLTRGGIIALVSVIVGVILTYLPKKRRRNDQWL